MLFLVRLRRWLAANDLRPGVHPDVCVCLAVHQLCVAMHGMLCLAVRELRDANVHVRAANLLSNLLPKRGRDGLPADHLVRSVQRLRGHELLSDDGLDLSALPGALHDVSRGLLSRGELQPMCDRVRMLQRRMLQRRVRWVRLRKRMCRMPPRAAAESKSEAAPPKTFAPGPAAPETTAPPAKAPSGDAVPPIPAEKAAPDIYQKKSSWQQPVAPPRQPTDNRTTARPVYQTGYFQLIASPPKTAPIHDASLGDDGWQAARD